MFYRTYQKTTSAYLGIFEKKIFEIPRPQPILVPNAVHVLPSNGIFKPILQIWVAFLVYFLKVSQNCTKNQEFIENCAL